MAKVLIIEDDPLVIQLLDEVCRNMGHQPMAAEDLKAGLALAVAGGADLVLLDVVLPDGSGLDGLPLIKAAPGEPEVIIMTGHGSPEGAELAVKNGAWDYIEKSQPIGVITLAIGRALQYRRAKTEKRQSRSIRRDRIIGRSPKLMACLDLLAQASETDANVLITGESGTGKEIFAEAIHLNSPRAERDFVVLDCAALPETLVESLLFGHERGAFTGADRPRSGLLKQAHHGTLFLDEVGELPLGMQKAFLRALQEHRFRPVGARDEVKSDFRLIAATNRDLEEMAGQGRFRQDLLFRLKSLVIELPPLRECREDIRHIALFHLSRLCDHYGLGTKGFAPEFLEALHGHDWPGNVRELINALETALANAGEEPTLLPAHLPLDIRVRLARAAVGSKPAPIGPPLQEEKVALPKLKEVRDMAVWQAERQYLKDLLALTGGEVKRSCRLSGVSRPHFYELLKKHKMTRQG